jgi:hypothetical protein
MKKIFVNALLLITSIWANAQRVIIIEQFTNSGCLNCANSNPAVFNFVNNTQNVACISYHSAFPYNDSMYFENTIDNNARINYYNVVGVPQTVINGNAFNSSSSSFPNSGLSVANNQLNIPPDYEITVNNFTFQNNMLNAECIFKSLSNTINNNLVAHIAVVEKNVFKNSYAGSPGNNTETVYKYVMRKMLPTANGTALSNTSLNGVDTITVSWPIQKIKNVSEIRLVAFVQNTNSKNILQASINTPSTATSIIDNSIDVDKKILLTNFVTNGKLQLNAAIAGTAQVFDLTGKLLFSQSIEKGQAELNVQNLSNGIFILKHNGQSQLFTNQN